MNMPPIVTLITDFGIADGYVGSMKGAMLRIAPEAHLVDITHHIRPQDIREAAFVLYTAYRFFPSQAVHLVVVDPGVGGNRRPIAVLSSHGAFVGPDNGVFSYVLANESADTVIELVNPRYRLPTVSETFHGRDIFAPAAAHLAAGVPINNLGPKATDPVSLPLPSLRFGPGLISGEVLHTDHFGNTITSLGRLFWKGEQLSLEPAFQGGNEEEARFRAGEVSVLVAGRELQGVCRTYADVEPGDSLALVGSAGHLEIAVREGSGAERFGLQPGDPVQLRWESKPAIPKLDREDSDN